MKTFFQLLIAMAVGFGMFFYYQLVLPASISLIFSIGIAIAILMSMVSGRFGLQPVAAGGATLAAWPGGALVASLVAGLVGYTLTDAQAAAGAVFTACLAAMGAYTVAQQRDRARDIATISIAAICVYTIVYAITSKDHLAISLAGFGVAAGVMTIKQQLILPPRQELALTAAAVLSFSAATAHAAALSVAKMLS